MSSFLYALTVLVAVTSASPAQFINRQTPPPPGPTTTSTTPKATNTTTTTTTTLNPAGTANVVTLPDFTGARVISSKNIYTGSLTAERCSSFCKGSQYIGFEFGKECFCAESIALSSVKIADNLCDSTCSGNSAQICGGKLALTLYKSTTMPNVANVPVPNFKALGCYTDIVTDRTLEGAVYDDLAMTTAKCAVACTINNKWTLFGVEFGRQCFCGNMLETTDKVFDVQCGEPCAGDKNTVCGGKLRLNVFSL